MYQLAVFKNPEVISSVSSNLNSNDIAGGIRCRLLDIPTEPVSIGDIKNGNWEESASSISLGEYGSPFTIVLDASDNSVSLLQTVLRKNKIIGEVIIYDVTGKGDVSHSYYFSNVFVNRSISSVKLGHQKVISLYCSCESFRQKTPDNKEPVLWDWTTKTHRYTGITR